MAIRRSKPSARSRVDQPIDVARRLFEEILIKDKEVVFVKPRPELDPFVRLNYEESTRKAFEGVTSIRANADIL